MDLLLKERKRLKLDAKEKGNINISSIKYIDRNIANLLSEKNRNKIMTSFQKIATSDNSCSSLGMWRQARKLFPKVLNSVQTGVLNPKGKIITKTSALKRRSAHPEIKELMRIKKETSR